MPVRQRSEPRGEIDYVCFRSVAREIATVNEDVAVGNVQPIVMRVRV